MPSLLFWILQWPYSFVAATNIDTFQKPYAARLQRISSYVSLNVQHKQFLIGILGSDRHFTSVISLLCNVKCMKIFTKSWVFLNYRLRTLSSRLLPDFSCGSLLKISSSKTSVFFFSLPMKITSAYKCRCRSLIPHVLEIRLASSPMRYVNGKHTTFPIRILYILTKERGKIKETNILLDEDCGTWQRVTR